MDSSSDDGTGVDLRSRIGKFKNNHDKICFDTWFSYFKIVCDAHNIPEEVCDEEGKILPAHRYRRYLFLVSLSDEVLLSLNAACFPKDAHDLPLSVLADNMREMYCPSDPVLCRLEFNRRNQREDESGRDYINAIQKLARHCNFGEFHKDALRDRLVCGIRDSDLRFTLLSTKDLTFDKACDIVRRNNDWSDYWARTTPCSSCGREHDKDKCPAQRWKCRRCKQFGHATQLCLQ